jgi:inorganic pyrophosphatase
MNLLHDITPGENAPETINVIIEINKGSKNKYEIDKVTGLIKLDRVMYTSQDYPFDYGFIPQTHWHDGDAVDVVLVTTHPLPVGILVEARPVGVIRMIDSGDRDEKIIAVPVEDMRMEHIKDLGDLNPHFLKETEHFFTTYKKLKNKVVEINKIEGAVSAREVILEGIEMYKANKEVKS